MLAVRLEPNILNIPDYSRQVGSHDRFATVQQAGRLGLIVALGAKGQVFVTLLSLVHPHQCATSILSFPVVEQSDIRQAASDWLGS